MQINHYEDRLKSSKAYQDTLEESEQMRFIFQYNTPGGPHTSSASVAVFESLISIKSSTADMTSSYTLFSTWTFRPLLNSSLEIKSEAVYFLRLYKNVIFAFSNFACSFFNLNITDLFPSEKRFKLFKKKRKKLIKGRIEIKEHSLNEAQLTCHTFGIVYHLEYNLSNEINRDFFKVVTV